MTRFYSDDIPKFFLDFGEVMTWGNSEGSNLFTGIFDAAFTAEQFQQTGVEHSGPSVTAKQSDLDGVAHGDTIRRDQTTYKVIGIQPDGTGLVLILLSED